VTLFPANPRQIRTQILRILKDGKTREKNEVLSILAKHFKLKMSEYTRKDPNSKRNSWDKRVTWELSWLRKRGLIKNVRLGHFHITALGKDILELCKS
jgi:restriction system protein